LELWKEAGSSLAISQAAGVVSTLAQYYVLSVLPDEKRSKKNQLLIRIGSDLVGSLMAVMTARGLEQWSSEQSDFLWALKNTASRLVSFLIYDQTVRSWVVDQVRKAKNYVMRKRDH
jgi:hypothetical protein